MPGNNDKACPDDERLALYLEGGLHDSERAAIRGHLADCPGCLALALGTASAAAGQGHLERLVAGGVMITFLKNTVEFIRDMADIAILPGPVGFGVRSRRFMEPNVVRFKKTIDGFETEVEVERLGPGEGEIRVRLSGNSEMVRVTLLSMERELESALVKHGPVIFEGIAFGRYAIQYSRNGAFLGEIKLEVKDG